MNRRSFLDNVADVGSNAVHCGHGERIVSGSVSLLITLPLVVAFSVVAPVSLTALVLDSSPTM